MRFVLISCLILSLSACETSAPKESRIDKMATGFCECTAQLAALNKQAVQLAADTSGNAAAIFKQMQAEYKTAKDCSASIISQYGKLKKEELATMEKALAGKCAELSSQRDLLREMLGE
jgi:hypothetical protein